MKKTFAYIFLLTFLLFGCKSAEDSFPGYNYAIKLIFEDAIGNNLLDSIGYIDEENAGIVSVEHNEYQLEIIPDPDFVTIPLSLLLRKTEKDKCLLFCAATKKLDPDYKASQISFKFKCPRIFGNNKDYSIFTKWKYLKNGTTECIYLSFENKEIELKIDTISDQQYPGKIAKIIP